MTNSINRCRTMIPALLLLTATAVVLPGTVAGQTAPVSGTVKMKQADGTETRTNSPQAAPSGTLSVSGEVSVNGTSAISGATVFSDSTVTTAKGSSAVVSLGKLGRVEVLPESTMKLSFTDSGITLRMLDAGRVRVSSSSGTSAAVTTRDGQAIAKDSKANVFIIDTSCGDTLVSVQAGKVELRAGSTVKQIAAGSQDTAGQASPGTRCLREPAKP